MSEPGTAEPGKKNLRAKSFWAEGPNIFFESVAVPGTAEPGKTILRGCGREAPAAAAESATAARPYQGTLALGYLLAWDDPRTILHAYRLQ